MLKRPERYNWEHRMNRIKNIKASISWSKQEDEILTKNRSNNTIKQLQVLLNGAGFQRSIGAIERHCRRLLLKFDNNQKPLVSRAATPALAKLAALPIEVRDVNWNKLLSMSKEYKARPIDRSLGKCKAERRIVSLSDTHFPFQRDDLLMEAVESAKGADVLVLNGDLFDCYGISSFRKEKVIPLLKEYAMVLEFLKGLVPLFKEIRLVRGNHEHRFSGFWNTATGESIEDPLGDDLLARLANGCIYDEGGMQIGNYKFPNVKYNQKLPWFTVVGKTIFAHPKFFSRIPGASVYQTYRYFFEQKQIDFDCIVQGHCFDTETEVLTNTGWKQLDTISSTDKVMTLNLSSHKTEFNAINGIYTYDHFKELIQFKNRHGLDIRVTPEHGIVHFNTYTQEYELGSAKDFLSRRLDIPCAAEFTSIEDYPISNDKLSFLAWVVTEGKFSRTKRYNANSLEHGQHRNFDAYRWYIWADCVSWIKEYLSPDKSFIWDLVNGLSSTQAKFLLEELCKGDGSKCGTKRWRAFYTQNNELAGQVQALALKAGLRSKLSSRKDPTKDNTLIVHLSRIQQRRVRESKLIPYQGKVWCLSVNNGTLVARRNGVVFITQNTHQQSKYIYEGTLLIEQGCLTARCDYQWDDSLRYRSQVNGFVEVWQDKDGNTSFDNTKLHYMGTQWPPRENE